MPRLPRISPIGIPVHVIQRGNNRQALLCFRGKIMGLMQVGSRSIPRNIAWKSMPR
ncbi:hypothetical protein H206_05150 [Candidatus Electrothrix aarhusensis]|uniref:Transposase n=1 Tax=Candidatus Electrothrix aarhusensis TaxID=1859131 RepID=A0A444J5G7_9BACT|nr:hypothetical protein H206_05150 [Candidatus Electrothrix aarhusensis]